MLRFSYELRVLDMQRFTYVFMCLDCSILKKIEFEVFVGTQQEH